MAKLQSKMAQKNTGLFWLNNSKMVEKDVDLDLGSTQSVAESDQNFNPFVSVRFRQLELAVNVVLDLTIRSSETSYFWLSATVKQC